MGTRCGRWFPRLLGTGSLTGTCCLSSWAGLSSCGAACDSGWRLDLRAHGLPREIISLLSPKATAHARAGPRDLRDLVPRWLLPPSCCRAVILPGCWSLLLWPMDCHADVSPGHPFRTLLSKAPSWPRVRPRRMSFDPQNLSRRSGSILQISSVNHRPLEYFS